MLECHVQNRLWLFISAHILKCAHPNDDISNPSPLKQHIIGCHDSLTDLTPSAHIREPVVMHVPELKRHLYLLSSVSLIWFWPCMFIKVNTCRRPKVDVIHGHIPGQSSERRAVCDPYPVQEDVAPRLPSPPTSYTPNITHRFTSTRLRVLRKMGVVVYVVV